MCLLPYPPKSYRGSPKKKNARPIQIAIPPVPPSSNSSTCALPPHLKAAHHRYKTTVEGKPVVVIEGSYYHPPPPPPTPDPPPPLPTLGETEAKARKQKHVDRQSEKRQRRESILGEIDFMHTLQEKLYPHNLGFSLGGARVGGEGGISAQDMSTYPVFQGHHHPLPPPVAQDPAAIKREKEQERERAAAAAEQRKLEDAVAGVQGQVQSMLRAQELKEARKEGKRDGFKEGESRAREKDTLRAEIERSLRGREEERLGWQVQHQYEALLLDSERRDREQERAERDRNREHERERERWRREDRDKDRDFMLDIAGLHMPPARDVFRQPQYQQQQQQQQQQIPYFVPVMQTYDTDRNMFQGNVNVNPSPGMAYSTHGTNGNQNFGTFAPVPPVAVQNQSGALCDPYVARKVVVKLDDIQETVQDLLFAQQQQRAGGVKMKAQARSSGGGGGGGGMRGGWDSNLGMRGGNGHGNGHGHVLGRGF